MGKAVKWAGIVIGGLILLILLILLIAPMFIDVQKYKPRIEQEVAKATGRPFNIGGDLKLSLFPWAGIAFSDLHLGNPKGFEEKDFVSIKAFDVQVKLLPLISKDIQIKRFVVIGPKIVLEKKKDGRTNLEGLGRSSKKRLEGEPEKKEERKGGEPMEGLPIKGLAVGEFAVREGEALWIDGTTGTRREIKDLTLELKDVSLDKPIQMVFSAEADGRPLSIEGKVGPIGQEPGKGTLPLDFAVKVLDHLSMSMKGELTDPATRSQFDLALQVEPFSPRKLMEVMGQPFPVQTMDPEVLNRVSLQFKVKGDPQRVTISDGKLGLDQSKITFSAKAKDFFRPDLTFEMTLDKIDADRYLPLPGEEKAVEKGKKPASEKKKTDYAPFRKPVLKGDVRIGELKIKGARLQEVRLVLKGLKGVYDIDPFAFKAYEGNLSTKVRLDVRGDVPKSSVNLDGKDFQVRPLIKDVMQKEFIEGTTFTQISLTMEGDDPDRIKKTLNGKGDLQFRDGAIVGIDLTGMVQNLKASFGLTEETEKKPRTDFSEFNVPFTLTNGLAKTPGTQLVSPLLRVLAAGEAHLVRETLDFRVTPKFVATLKGQGDQKERGGLMVPVLVSGTFASPKFRPDLEGLLKQQLKGGIPKADDLKKVLEGSGTKEDGKTESSKEKVKGLLKGFKLGQ